MPVTYSMDSARRLIRTTCSGPVTSREVIEHFRTLRQDPLRTGELDVLLNVSDAELIPDSSDLGRVVAELRAQEGELPFRLCAIVAPSDPWFGMMRMFEVFAGKYFRAIRVFRDMAAAETWLGSREMDNRSRQ
ncbi:MAG TPA: hypothetical protein VE377_18355 [Candidatus Dormibacteraeota bacterium]|nr:hypothetical protein [Candidatus Dormibacteraeota bacterium]